jgi:hypothetical protein
MIIAVPISSAAGKRPGPVWAILVLYAFGLLVGSASLFAVFSGALRLPQREADFYANFGIANFFGLALSAVLGTGSMIQLYRMRKSAVYFVAGVFLVTMAKEVWYLPKLMSLGHGLTMHVVSACISLWIVCYVWHLRRVGLLK